MFTGLVQECARVSDLARASGAGAQLVLTVESRLLAAGGWGLGASVAVNGICLTVVGNEPSALGRLLSFDVSPETLARTNLGALLKDAQVHLEPALNLGDALGGHLVSGHIDGIGRLFAVKKDNEFQWLEFELSSDARTRVAPYLVEKGSVAIDGVSLTVNGVRDEADKSYFDVMLVPHTLSLTRFGNLQPGDTVNLEADLVAKYVCRNLEFRNKFHR